MMIFLKCRQFGGFIEEFYDKNWMGIKKWLKVYKSLKIVNKHLKSLQIIYKLI